MHCIELQGDPMALDHHMEGTGQAGVGANSSGLPNLDDRPIYSTLEELLG